MERFNTRINEALRYSNHTQQELADFLGCHKTVVNGWVLGKARLPNNIEKIGVMAKYLDVNPAWLAGFDIPKDLTAKDLEFLEEYKKLNDSAKEIIDATLRAFSLKKENQKLA